MDPNALALMLALIQPAISTVPNCVEEPARVAALPLCRADHYVRQFRPELRGQPDNYRWLELAIRELQDAAERSRGTPDFVVALEKLIDLYAPRYLNDLSWAKPLLSAWIEASPTDTRPRLEMIALLEADGHLDSPKRLMGEIKGLEDPESAASRQLAAFREKWRPRTPTRLGGNIAPPVLVKYVPAKYPDAAREARAQGVVIIEARIDETGKVVGVRVLRSIPLLDEAALDAVRQWEYKPTVVNGKAIPVIATVDLTFTLGPG